MTNAGTQSGTSSATQVKLIEKSCEAKLDVIDACIEALKIAKGIFVCVGSVHCSACAYRRYVATLRSFL